MIENKIDTLTLMSGAPVNLPTLDFCLLQPKIKDIAIIGEINFFKYLSYFFINKKTFDLETEEISDFDVFMKVLCKNIDIQKNFSEILILLVQDLEEVKFFESCIILIIAGHECIIDEPKFLIIKETVKQIFKLDKAGVDNLNPANKTAEKIAEKLKRRQEVLSSKNQASDQAVFSNLISVLSVGSNSLTLVDCLDLTVFQLYNIFERFNLYFQFNLQVQSMLQGAKDIDLVEWTKQF
jgi:hypothetical protein